MKADQLLRDTAAIVGGDREESHGSVVDSFRFISQLWSTYIGEAITARDVAVMMSLLKIGRMNQGDYNADDYMDALGYMAIAGEIEDYDQPRQITATEIQERKPGELIYVEKHARMSEATYDYLDGKGYPAGSETALERLKRLAYQDDEECPDCGGFLLNAPHCWCPGI